MHLFVDRQLRSCPARVSPGVHFTELITNRYWHRLIFIKHDMPPIRSRGWMDWLGPQFNHWKWKERMCGLGVGRRTKVMLCSRVRFSNLLSTILKVCAQDWFRREISDARVLTIPLWFCQPARSNAGIVFMERGVGEARVVPVNHAKSIGCRTPA